MATSSNSSSPSKSTTIFSLLAALLLSSSLSFTPEAYHLGGGRRWGKKVGGWTDIPDASSNQELRQLGCFSVDEYNLEIRGAGQPLITFSGVLSGQRQVVSGFKYRLRIAAVDSGTGQPIVFEAVVVVRPWIHSRSRSRDLVSFTPIDELPFH
ncbi:Cysteine proteinase inhibitor 4 [Platanthera guangdongensis]|uniref:Cysteine proteinase inhibitor 4 n=1 Tax=Platanthera guangdongensis TaxID=2320717 RepID=A0ABR2MH02_9ASPA